MRQSNHGDGLKKTGHRMLSHAVSMAVTVGLLCGTMVAGVAAYGVESDGIEMRNQTDSANSTESSESSEPGQTESGEPTDSAGQQESGNPNSNDTTQFGDSADPSEGTQPSENEQPAQPSQSDEDSDSSADAKQAMDFGAHTVKNTVSPSGTTINLFDYWMENRDSNDTGKNGQNGQPNWVAGSDIGIDKDHQFKFVYGGNTCAESDASKCPINSWTGVGAGPRRGIVSNTLADGMPKLADVNGDESLSYLFSPSDTSANEYRQSFSNVSGLLQLNDEGYYYYNSHQNFASFDEGKNAFTLYDQPGVKTGGSSPNGQFFPFNKASDVFESDTTDGSLVQKDIKSTNPALRHWHGMTLSSRFMQPAEGKVQSGSGKGQDMTFDFSGDDDVWIFIDGVLVGDLGGIHDENRISINFATGAVTTYKKLDSDTGWNGDVDHSTTIKAMFDKANKADVTNWDGDTFTDNTYHTLKFFYLERGNYDSNMHLQFNLVPIPESSIVKIDQAGNVVPGAKFDLYATDSDYKVADGQASVFHGTTDSDGKLILADDNGDPISISELKEQSGGKTNFVLRETIVPAGYRSPGDIKLQYHESTVGTKFSPYLTVAQDNIWETGAYAGAGVHVTAPTKLYVADADGGRGNQIEDAYTADGKINGTLFAVIMMYTYTGSEPGAETNLSNGDNWTGISGGPSVGWDKNGKTGWDAVLGAEKYTFELTKQGSNAQYQASIPELPGDPTEYYNLLNAADRAKTKYTVAYYYTTAKSASEATQRNSKRLWLDGTAGESFSRTFSVTLHVPNISNALIVQKLDQNGKPLSSGSATFSLYKKGDVTVNEDDGTYKVNADAQPYDTTQTRDLDGSSRLKIPAAAYFPSGTSKTKLETGEYWLIETEAPEHYVKNAKATKVVVDSTGVYADAGTANDGITVRRGVGSLVKTLSQFGDKGNIDSTLHDVTASLKVATDYQGDETEWDTDATDIGGSPVEGMPTEGRQSLNLTFGGVGNNAHNVMLEYGPTDASVEANLMNTSLGVDVGWPALNITQNSEVYGHTDADKANGHTDAPKQNLINVSLNNLFSNTAIVRVQDQLSTKLTIKKVVEGANVPDNVKFTFTVKLLDRKGNALNASDRTDFDKMLNLTYHTVDKNDKASESQALMLDGNSTTTFELAHGESVVIEGLPDQAKYEVSENGMKVPSGNDLTLDKFHTDYTVEAKNLLANDKRTWITGTGDGREMQACPAEQSNGARIDENDFAQPKGCQLATRTEASVIFTNALLGPVLPSTGGMGVKSLLWCGLLLVGCSLAGLRYARRR